MEGFDYGRLRFRRQYLLSRSSFEIPFQHHSTSLPNQYRLDYHIDLKFTEVVSGKNRIILLGDVYDWFVPEWDNHQILKGCIGLPFNDLIDKFIKFSGRFVVIVIQEDSIRIFHDFSSSRKIYYTNLGGHISCSSNPHLLARVLDISPTKDPSLLRYYQSDYFRKNLCANVGDLTYYDEIKQLKAHFHLNIITEETQRYWPVILERGTEESCAVESARIIHGFLLAADARYPLMIPVTSGYDSRVILAASKDIREKPLFYLNTDDSLRESQDFMIPQKMLAGVGLELFEFDLEQEADEQFRNIYYDNNPFANTEFLDIIYNYWKHHPEKLNLPGNTLPVVEVLQNSYRKVPRAKDIARSYNLGTYEFAIKYFEKWLEEAVDACKAAEMNLYNLLFLEERNSNWSTQLQQDKDIAQEELVIFNSGYLISLLLTYDERRRNKPFKELHKDLVKYLWPELLNYPYNPSLKTRVLKIIARMGLLTPIMQLKRDLIGMYR